MSCGIKVNDMKKILFMLPIIFAIVVLFASPVKAAITSEAFDVEVVVVTGDSEQTNANLVAQAYGTHVGIDLTAFSEDFVYFIANGEVINDVNHQFRVTSDLYVVAVLKEASEIVSVFLDSNGQFIGVDYLLSGETPVAPDVTGYTKPGYSVDTMNPWAPVISALTDNEIYELQYSLDAVETFVITTTNATASNQTPAFNEIVTLTADGGATSGYWMENQAVIAYGTTYSFSALTNRDITFVDSANSEEAVVSFTDASGIRSGYDSYLGQVYLPDGYTLVEYGFIFKTVSVDELITMDNADVIKASSVMADTSEYLRSVTTATYEIVRAYMVIDNGTSLETIYSQGQIGPSAALLSSIKLDGVELADFDEATNTYYYMLPDTTLVYPHVTATSIILTDSVEITQGNLPGYATIVVTSLGGTENEYIIYAEAENTDTLATPYPDVNFDNGLEQVGVSSAIDVTQSTEQFLNGTSSLKMITGEAYIGFGFDGSGYPEKEKAYSIGMWLYVDGEPTSGDFIVKFLEKEVVVELIYDALEVGESQRWVYVETSVSYDISVSAAYVQVVLINNTDTTIYVDALRLIEQSSMSAPVGDTTYSMIAKDLGFEDEDAWSIYEVTPGDVTYDSFSHSGDQSLKMTAGKTWLGIGFDGLPYPEKGDTVKVGLWIYVDSATATSVGGLTIKLIEKEGTVVGDGIVITYVTVDGDFAFDTWTYIETTSATISEDPAYIQILIEEATDGVVYVDDVTLIKVND
jgi:hypothetical protein